MSVTEKINLLDFNRAALEAFFVANGEKPFRARQLMQWVHQRGITDFAQMTDMSKILREFLQQNCRIERPRILTQQRSADGTRKWLLGVDDSDNAIECVLIPEKSRMTLCVSSQLGCTLNCSFCSTAKQGFNRNLTTAEIIAQLHFAHHALREEGYQQGVTNVVMMGMGEPLLNFDAVIAAVDMMCDDFGYALSKRRVTISTAGVVPAMEKLEQVTDVALAVSLHAPNDQLRNQLVPLNRKYPISDLMRACRGYIDGYKSRKITFEYVMLEGVNDSLEHARELVGVIGNIPCKLNLIPFNPYPRAIYRCSDTATIDRFRDYTSGKGIVTVTRRARGDDIDAACGQLVGAFQDRSRRSEKYQLSLAQIGGVTVAH
ncbi:MAG: 23S rRNA (adenine(2503)-C(2))-methyltransferase RlmN [Gammaproteobacteria bacterium]|nr:23S rRNA (adenine(2503)-C(2))-methyltransferase RlmN [Gammaproteobacteria bacterium]MDH3537625.1 23S rRNA (adenine(2503)-C(2))-methyltransferase RlmN [Gammaproteobacteria bacterium]